MALSVYLYVHFVDNLWHNRPHYVRVNFQAYCTGKTYDNEHLPFVSKCDNSTGDWFSLSSFKCIKYNGRYSLLQLHFFKAKQYLSFSHVCRHNNRLPVFDLMALAHIIFIFCLNKCEHTSHQLCSRSSNYDRFYFRV